MGAGIERAATQVGQDHLRFERVAAMDVGDRDVGVGSEVEPGRTVLGDFHLKLLVGEPSPVPEEAAGGGDVGDVVTGGVDRGVERERIGHREQRIGGGPAGGGGVGA